MSYCIIQQLDPTNPWYYGGLYSSDDGELTEPVFYPDHSLAVTFRTERQALKTLYRLEEEALQVQPYLP